MFGRPLRTMSLSDCCSFYCVVPTVYNLSVCLSYCLVWRINVLIGPCYDESIYICSHLFDGVGGQHVLVGAGDVTLTVRCH